MKLPDPLLFASRILMVLPAAMVLTSCGLFGGDERPVYHGAEYYKNLEVPPDLTAPDTSDQLAVQRPTDEAIQRFRDNNKLDTVITPKFDGVRVVNYAGSSWLEIDNNVDIVWLRLQEFWESEGIKLVDVRPMLGYMETEWIERLDADAGFFKSLFQKFEPDQKDKFRVRVEPFENDLKTRIYIAHSRIERVVQGEYSETFTWQSLPSDIEAEREIVSRMALFAGQSRDHMLKLVENYRPYSSLIKVDPENNIALTMKGSMDFVWHRAMRALDRMRTQDIRQQKENNTIYFAIGKSSVEQPDVEGDELAQSSWLMQLFTDSDEDVETDENRQYRLEFTDLDGSIEIQVKDAGDSQTQDEDGAVSGTALAEQLRNMLVENLE
jgi:outer membrane protein assembly factor BamC